MNQDSTVLLTTKFLIPRLRSDHLARPRLIERLIGALARPLTLVSAPPGSGKTTLLAAFAQRTTAPLVWYQLDPADNDPKLFLRYLVEGLRRTWPDVCPTTLALLGFPDTPLEQILRVLINEVAESVETDTVIILEDYHTVESQDVHRTLEFLLEQGPPQLHYAVSTRADPPLPLARMRGRGKLAELRATDLRFTLEEVGQLAAALSLTPEQVQLLEERTEGWAAGLQLALTTLAQRPQEADEVIRFFRGSNRYVFDYLADEVLQRQPADVQRFLLRSSIFARFNAALCATVLGEADAQAMIERLERKNLFLVSLDHERRWYCYQQLFHDFLANRLYQESPEEARQLELRAADHYAGQARWDLAAEHYVAAGSSEGLAQAIRALAPGYLPSGRVETLRRYLAALPAGLVDEDPDLMLIQGHTLRYQGQVEEAARNYERARDHYQAQGDQAGVCRALTQLARVARLRGTYREALTVAERAVEQAAPENHAERAEALMSLAKTSGFLHGMAHGYRLGEEALREARLAGPKLPRSERARLLCSQAQLSWWYGDPFASVAHCQAALAEEGEAVTPVACQVHVVMATPYIYWGDLATARRMADQGMALAKQLQFTEWLPMAHTTLGNILTRQNELAEGEAHLRRAITLSRELGVESYADLMASGFLAFNLTQQGRLVEGRRACEEALHLRAGSPETYELCVCRSVLGDVLLDMNDLDTALEYFLNLRRVCTARQFRLPLAMVYFAIGYLHLIGGRQSAALEQIRRSLELVCHANAVQLYVDQGQRAQVVCEAALEAGMHREFVRRVMTALAGEQATEGVPRRMVPGRAEGDDGAPRIDVCCLGDFRLYCEGRELDRQVGLVGRPRQLLAYFITQGDRRVSLERVVEDMWPGSDPERGQAVFHTTLYRLRKALVRAAGPGDYIAHDSGEYQLERERFRTDVDGLEEQVGRARELSGEAAMDACEAAAAFYQGPYLTNLYETWTDDERRRLAAAHVDALRLLAVQATAAGDCHRAIRACETLLAADPLMEQVHCDVMRLWHRLGNRAAVTRQYETLRRLLAEELATTPLPETEVLYRELVSS